MDSPLSILVVDDDPKILKLFEDLFGRGREFRIRTAEGSTKAWDLLNHETFDVGIFDIRMAGEDGLDLLARVRKKFTDLQVIMLTASNSIDDAVKAIKLGALDYVTKPFKIGQITAKLNHLARHKQLEVENKLLRARLGAPLTLEGLIGMTPSMLKIKEMIRRLAEGDSNVLIVGESGTGKELVARAIHYEGARRNKPFVTVDCGAVHRSLLESELFGHEKGAFTGAFARKTGLFEKANHGTLFLDEVAEIPVELQPSLLRAIEEKKIRPIGGTDYLGIDIRIVAATNRDLEEQIKQEQFRRDLYYRLNVVTLAIPPLRERRDDIPVLVDHFIEKHADLNHGKIRSASPEVVEVFLGYDWPGNIRELEHVVLRAFAVGKSEQIQMTDLPPTLVQTAGHNGWGGRKEPGKPRSLEELETDVIKRTLREYKGDTAAASRILGIDRSTLYRKIKRYRIDIDRLKKVETATAS